MTGAYSNPQTAWSNVVSRLSSFKSLTGNAKVEIGPISATGVRLVLDEPEDHEVRDALDLAETMGLRSQTRERTYSTVVEVA